MPDTLSGRMVIFPDGREVFLAQRPSAVMNRVTWLLGFKSAEGKLSRFELSDEAFRALCLLRDDPTHGEPTMILNAEPDSRALD